ncbi:hypothetical protein LC612_22715 [Nostoc sp. CHAB 5834]|nr:hypothetical protein [Nostoc sp. CHAB 5834]
MILNNTVPIDVSIVLIETWVLIPAGVAGRLLALAVRLELIPKTDFTGLLQAFIVSDTTATSLEKVSEKPEAKLCFEIAIILPRSASLTSTSALPPLGTSANPLYKRLMG